MAGASMKSIKLRIHSMQNTRQITKAMEMVAASKMNKAQEKALRTRPYYTTLHSTLSGIAAATRDFPPPTCKSGRKSGSAAWPSPATAALRAATIAMCCGWPPKPSPVRKTVWCPSEKGRGILPSPRRRTPHRGLAHCRESFGGWLLYTGAPFGGAVPLRSGGCHRAGLYPLEQSPFPGAVCAAAAAAAPAGKARGK